MWESISGAGMQGEGLEAGLRVTWARPLADGPSSSRYLALVSALASGADWLFIPEAPPEDGWENFMCERLGEVSGQGLLPRVPPRAAGPVQRLCPRGCMAGSHPPVFTLAKQASVGIPLGAAPIRERGGV